MKSSKDALGRRVWDKELYRQKAEEAESGVHLRVGKVAPSSIESLKERRIDIDIEANLNKKHHAEDSQHGAFYCKTCEQTLFDSQSWLSHINGRNHNRLLGMSMKVQKTTADRVIAKMLEIKNKNKRPLSSI